MKRMTFNILFYLRKNRPLRDGTLPIYMRLTINGEQKETSMGLSVHHQDWNAQGQRMHGRSKNARNTNLELAEAEAELRRLKTEMKQHGQEVTANKLLNLFNGNDCLDATLLELFEKHQVEFKELADQELMSIRIWKRYNTTIKHIKDYLKAEHGSEALLAKAVDLKFIHGFEHYLKTQRSLDHNSAMMLISLN